MAEEGTTQTTTETGGTTTTATSVPVVKPENMVPQTVVDRITAEKWNATRAKEEAERKLALSEATIEELRKIATGGEGGGTTTSGAKEAPAPQSGKISADELRRLVNEQSATERFNEACNASVIEGKKAHTDFEKVVLQDLTRLSPIYDPRAGGPILPMPLVEAALETGEAHEVLYALGKDPSNAERIMRLGPIKQAVEIAKFHDKLVAARGLAATKENEEEKTAAETKEAEIPPNTSSAPAPIRSRAGSGTGGTRPAFDLMDPSKSNTKDWIRAREKQVREQRESRMR